MGDRLRSGTGTQGAATSRSSNNLPAATATDTGSLGGADGTVDRVLKRETRSKFTGAIFIHAGAGFHSHQNELVHLEACKDAALMGIRFLRSGATATEAVEAALRVLEDKEITNAGYGSNLSMDGTVECDATIVDYLGRSGACGAVPNIRNPICLAKLILDKSTQPLTLRRVPPNILVGEGARNFADKHGINVVPNDNLISKNARDRFVRWQEDLKRADERLKKEDFQRAACPNSQPCQQYETLSMGSNESSRTGTSQQRDHANAILTGTWNEGQPDSPCRGTPALEKQAQFPPSSTPMATTARVSPIQVLERSPLSYLGSSNPGKDRAPSPKRHRRGQPTTGLAPTSNLAHEGHRDSGRSPQPLKRQPENSTGTPSQESLRDHRGTKRPFPYDEEESEDKPPMDLITDTVGAIAIDEKGRIAAGSSSGGIGMKHRGRLGPAALVGIGTAVVPVDPSDEDGICVATVTSGTGEHMATTMASQRCAERIYRNTRRGPSGQDVEEFNEDKIIESFVNQDFMDHPGVTNCTSVGAIGVMTVKKTKNGFYLYFAHNTDSFALASMGGSDKEPMCVMSRLGSGGTVTGGARKIRLD